MGSAQVRVSERNIRDLSERTGIAREYAEGVLRLMGDNIEDAVAMSEALDRAIYIIKGEVAGDDVKYLCTFLAAIDALKGQLEKLVVLVLKKEEAYRLNINQPWNELLDAMFAMKMGRGELPEMSYRLHSYLEQRAFANYMDQVVTDLKDEDEADLKELFEIWIREAIFGEETRVNLAVERITRLQYMGKEEEWKKEREAQWQREEKRKEDIVERMLEGEDVLIVMKSEMILDPVEGLLVNDLQRDDVVIVNVRDEREEAQYMARLLNKQDEDVLLPLPATVIGKEEEETGRYVVVFNFGPGVYGKAIGEANTKVKGVKAKQETTKRRTKAEKKEPQESELDEILSEEEEKGIGWGFYLSIAAVILLFILLIIIWFGGL
ncbi:MAG: hypothetical protein ACUVXI_07225 [bacterium]